MAEFLTFEEFQAGADAFDRLYFERYGRYPAESPLAARSPSLERRRQAIERLAEQGATQGERDAAAAALRRLEENEPAPAGDEDEYGAYLEYLASRSP